MKKEVKKISEAAALAAKKKALYTHRANIVKKAGFKVTYSGNKKASPQQKAAVSRAYYRISTYVKPEHNFTFRRANSSRLRKLRGTLSDQQITPSGFFVQVPRGVAKNKFRVSVSTKGEVSIKTPGRRDVILKLNAKRLARDPLKEITSTLGKKKPRFTKLQVNGYEVKGEGFKTDDPESVKLFYEYWETLFSELTDEATRQAAREENPREKRYKGRTMTAEEVADKFTLKLIY